MYWLEQRNIFSVRGNNSCIPNRFRFCSTSQSSYQWRLRAENAQNSFQIRLLNLNHKLSYNRHKVQAKIQI